MKRVWCSFNVKMYFGISDYTEKPTGTCSINRRHAFQTQYMTASNNSVELNKNAFFQTHLLKVVTPMLRCLGNICSGPDKFTVEAKQNAELLPSLCKYLTSDLRHVRKETLWVLSNMTGSPHMILVI